MTHGRVPSVVASQDDLRAAAASQGGDGTIAFDGLTWGRMVDGGPVGKTNARYAKFATKGALLINVPHACGYVPAFFIPVRQSNPNTPTTDISVLEHEYDKWTATEIRVRVNNRAGSLAGSEIWLIVGGER